MDGERVLFIVCHLRSKGGDDPLFGRRQPPVRWSEEQRGPQATLVRSSVDGVLALNPAARIVVLGDLNDFEFRQPVEISDGRTHGQPDRAPARVPERSTYVYQGNSQTLDHIIVSPALADGAEIEVIHVNADHPASERASDHDPVIARFRIGD